MDDDLRPAMARFGNITGNVKDAQKLLKITLDAAAGSGRSQEKISKAVGQAYGGNTTALQRMFPELRKSKDVLGDFAKTYEGLAVANADPFMKFNNSMDILKEKLGVVVLPLIIDAIDQISKPGGLIETVGKFFEDVANPKTDAGKTFQDIKDAVGQTIQGVKDFFALFGGGDSMEGFKNISKALVDMLPALLALKAIMMLASAGKAIQSLVTAMTMIQGKNALPTGNGLPPVAPLANPAAAAGGLKTLSFLKALPMIGVGLAPKEKLTDPTIQKLLNDPNFSEKNKAKLREQYGITNNVTINVTNADPKATVDAVSAYLKQNGSLPFIGKAGR
jgi:hypothetical protein